jgi:hypothetical protein
MSDTLNTALAFARKGIAVVPVWWPVERGGRLVCACGRADCNSPAKHPIGRVGKGPLIAPNGVYSATTDSGVIKHWCQLAPEANLAVSTASLIVLDVDPRHDGFESLNRLSKLGEMPPTWSVKTGSGGSHIYFRRPEGLDLKSPVIAENIIKAGGEPPLGPGIDIPSYVIAPPSRHVCGRCYEWDDHPSDAPLAEAPPWLVERLAGTERKAAATSPIDWEHRTARVVTEYADDELARVAGKLMRAVSLPSGFVMELLAAWNAAYCRPPLTDHDVRRIFDRIARRENERLERELER